VVSTKEVRKMIEAWFPDANGEEVAKLVELFVVATLAIDEEPSEPA